MWKNQFHEVIFNTACVLIKIVSKYYVVYSSHKNFQTACSVHSTKNYF